MTGIVDRVYGENWRYILEKRFSVHAKVAPLVVVRLSCLSPSRLTG